MSLTVQKVLDRCHVRGECRIWKGAISSRGVPYIYDESRFAAHGRAGSMVSGRQFVYQRCCGPTNGRVIVMTCGQQQCLAKTHMLALSLGNARRFYAERGSYQSVRCKVSRAVNGMANAKLNADLAESIRQRVAAGERRDDLAQEHGVDPSTIDRVMNGLRYARRMAPNSSVFNMARQAA